MKKEFNKKNLISLAAILTVIVMSLTSSLIAAQPSDSESIQQTQTTTQTEFQKFLHFHFPTDVKGVITTVAEITIAVGFLFLIAEYKNARKQRHEDTVQHYVDEMQKCSTEYYEMLSTMMSNPVLLKFYEEMDYQEHSYWKKISRDSEKKELSTITRQQIYDLAERTYYLCGRVHYLRSITDIDYITKEWDSWDAWIAHLLTSKTFRGFHVDLNYEVRTDFGKHVDKHLKALANKPTNFFPENELKTEADKNYKTHFEEYLKGISPNCECSVCIKNKNNPT